MILCEFWNMSHGCTINIQLFSRGWQRMFVSLLFPSNSLPFGYNFMLTREIRDLIGNSLGRSSIGRNPKRRVAKVTNYLPVRVRIDISKPLSQVWKIWSNGKSILIDNYKWYMQGKFSIKAQKESNSRTCKILQLQFLHFSKNYNIFN